MHINKKAICKWKLIAISVVINDKEPLYNHLIWIYTYIQ